MGRDNINQQSDNASLPIKFFLAWSFRMPCFHADRQLSICSSIMFLKWKLISNITITKHFSLLHQVQHKNQPATNHAWLIHLEHYRITKPLQTFCTIDSRKGNIFINSLSLSSVNQLSIGIPFSSCSKKVIYGHQITCKAQGYWVRFATIATWQTNELHVITISTKYYIKNLCNGDMNLYHSISSITIRTTFMHGQTATTGALDSRYYKHCCSL